ncbi:MAG: hypothetical protein JXA71_20660 [Chitinispirillaceae bacterium]|nr:hypothetical protein [Chitinispirillaceae bacterium]
MTRTPIHKLGFCAFLWLVFPLFTDSAASSELELSVLPADENEALRMLEEGILDSSVWRKIEQYYAMPLRVSQGDLRILQDLFPELPSDLPAEPDGLSRYLPWDNGAVERIFVDFPDLAPFRPILSFDNGPAVPFPGQTGFYFSRRGAADSGRQYALFSIGDPARAAASGRVDFTDAYGRWFRRSVSAAPLPGVRFACGNFSPKRKAPFVSGYFPRAGGGTDTAVSSTWFYGTARTWNGAAVSRSLPHENGKSAFSETEVFFHAGRSERIGQLSCSAVLSGRFTGFGGVSYLRTTDDGNPAKDFGFLHTGIAFSPAPKWKCELQGSVNFDDFEAIPWQASVSHGTANSSFKGTFTGVPAHYAAPRSETVRLMRTQAKTDSVSGYLMGSELLFRKKLNRFLSFAPRLNLLLNNGTLRYLFSSAELSGRAWCTYRVWYSWSPLFHDTGSVFRQQASAECFLPVTPWTRIVLTASRTSQQDYRSSRVRIYAPVTVNTALELAPSFMAYISSTGTCEKTAGIRQRLLLCRKTFSDMTIEQELPFSSWETIRVRGKMSFYL